MEINKDAPVDQALVAGLASRAGELATIAEDLISTVRRDRAIKVIFAVIGIILIAGMMSNLMNTNATKNNTKLIVSCTDPRGSCYMEARESATTNVKLINDTVSAAAFCARQTGNDTYELIRQCIVATLAHG